MKKKLDFIKKEIEERRFDLVGNNVLDALFHNFYECLTIESNRDAARADHYRKFSYRLPRHNIPSNIDAYNSLFLSSDILF